MKGRHVFGENGNPDRYYLDGEEVTKAQYDEAFPDKPIGDGTGLVAWKPLASDALAVHPKQVKEAEQDAKNKGVPVDFMPDGRPVFTSREQRKRYCAAYGFRDNNAGYGDQADGGPRRAERDEKAARIELADGI